MTPLPRWVLLALLLAGASAASKDHACVRLCRAQNRGPGIGGVCDYQQKLVIQSSGGRFPLQRLFRLCLNPCTGGLGSPRDLPLFDGSQLCRSFRELLIRRQACSCEALGHGRTWNSEQKNTHRLERSFKDFEHHQLKVLVYVGRLLAALKRIAGNQAVVASDVLGNQVKLNSRDFPEDKMKLKVDEEQVNDKGEENPVETGIENAPVSEVQSTEEPSVDWDRWCMAQCDNGQGGSACNCDIIP